MQTTFPTVLTIAGSDSGGGAGIQADLKTFAMLETYGASVVTALTAQNSTGVASIHAPEPKFVTDQLRAVLGDLHVGAAKTGMLFSAKIVAAVAEALANTDFPLVVDPVCVAASGDKLLEDDAIDAMREKLFPRASLVTPNRFEAEALTGIELSDQDSAFAAIEKLLFFGPKAVLLKGGHFDDFGSVTDWLGLAGHPPLPMIQPRVETKNLHGTGCTLSAAIAAYLARGRDVTAAVSAAQRYLNLGLRASYAVGKGPGPANHAGPLLQTGALMPAVAAVTAAARRLARTPGVHRLAPETGLGLALCLPWADRPEEVVGLDGRIVPGEGGNLFVPGCAAPGADTPLAMVLLGARAAGVKAEAAAFVRHGKGVLEALERLGIAVISPADAKGEEEQEGPGWTTFDWETFAACREAGAPETPLALVFDPAPGTQRRVVLLAADMPGAADTLVRLSDALDRGRTRGVDR